MPTKRPFCLSIAGFDPSGGAGVLADIKTFEQNMCQGLSVITANTIQTENAFVQPNWINSETILLQLRTLLERYNVNFFKIGLIESSDLLEKLIATIYEFSDNSTIVWDPILSATAGGRFDENRFSKSFNDNIYSNLIITPNLHEYQALNLVESRKTIYLKGGHSTRKGNDILFWKENKYPLSPHIKTDFQKHGTGCIFSSALLANLAKEYPMIKSCLRAKRYVEKRIVSNRSLLAYHK